MRLVDQRQPESPEADRHGLCDTGAVLRLRDELV